MEKLPSGFQKKSFNRKFTIDKDIELIIKLLKTNVSFNYIGSVLGQTSDIKCNIHIFRRPWIHHVCFSLVKFRDCTQYHTIIVPY